MCPACVVRGTTYGDGSSVRVSQDDRHAESLRRPRLTDPGLVVIKPGVGADLLEIRIFEGPLRGNVVTIGICTHRCHAEIGGKSHEGSQCFRRVTVPSCGRRQAVTDLNDCAIRGSLEADATDNQAVGLTCDLVVAEWTLLAVLLGSPKKAADGGWVPFERVVGRPGVACVRCAVADAPCQYNGISAELRDPRVLTSAPHSAQDPLRMRNGIR